MKKIEKILVFGILTLFLFGTTTPVFGTDEISDDYTIILDVSFSEPEFEKIRKKKKISISCIFKILTVVLGVGTYLGIVL